ncbi:MAG: OmpA family protein [Deltaproteobacteria bacterium]|nr:OmpA family protein [Deltaproteobacteria bacterium]
MTGKYGWLALLGCLLALAACAPKDVVVLIPNPDGRVGQVEVKNSGGSQTLREAGQATFVASPQKAPEAPAEMQEAEIQSRFGSALAARPLAPLHFLLYFQPNSIALVDDSRALLPKVVHAVQDRSSVDVSVVGHCDTLGDEQYNLKLSLQRAQAVAQRLIGMGLDPKILEITSHGESRLLIPTGDNVAEPRNRRVEVTVR